MTFKVLIIGGSITGLTLAAILERYGIDYALIEKHANVAPLIGASLGLVPHGSRILDQLGCFEELLPYGNGFQDMKFYGPDGKLMATHAKLGAYFEAMLGYRFFFVERQRVLRALWGAIKDKSKVYLSCKVTKVVHTPRGIQVETADGHVFTGNMVVGCDGVYSRTRDEVWRLAEADGHETVSDRKSIQNKHTAIFGISHGLPQVKPGDIFKHMRPDRSYLCVGTPTDGTLWFVFFNSQKHAVSSQQARYTDQSKDKHAAEFAHDQLRPDLTFAELYRTSPRTSMVPLEEFVLERFYYGRILLLGDAVHKIHPITGQGGNAAIEDCAFFANRLHVLLETTDSPADCQLEIVFQELQEARRTRTSMLMREANATGHVGSFNNCFLERIMLHVFCLIPAENLLAGLADTATAGEPLQYLPLPTRSKAVLPYNDEIQIEPKIRPFAASCRWACLFLLIASLQYVVPLVTPNVYQPNYSPGSIQYVLSPLDHYSNMLYLAVNVFWTIESYRSVFSLGVLLSSIPWILLAQHAGWGLALSIYLSIWTLSSSMSGFYYPWPRAILPSVAQALPITACITNLPPTIAILEALPLLSTFNTLTAVHLSIPLVATLLSTLITCYCGRRWEPFYQFGNWDMKYLIGTYSTSLLFASFSHFSFVYGQIIPIIQFSTGAALLRTAEVTNIVTLTLLIATWLLFTAWDLRRVNIVTLGLGRTALCIFLGTILVGPGATLIAAWAWREQVWEKVRQRISDERYTKFKVNSVIQVTSQHADCVGEM